MTTLRRRLLILTLCATLVGCNDRWESGDRVLVAKCLYETGVMQPRRFDVVVFKYPDQPTKDRQPYNYIKRLMGLPGELLAIFMGRLYRYVPEPNEAPLYDDSQIAAKELWRLENMHQDDEKARGLFHSPGRFEIVRKSPEVMMATRRIVYDNDLQPLDLKKLAPRWDPAKDSAWKTSDDLKSYSSAGAGKSKGVDWLRYQHRVHIRHRFSEPIVGGDKFPPQLITDVMGYNMGEHVDWNNPESARSRLSHLRSPQHWVGDLMLECQVEVRKNEGELWLELSKGIHRYRAKWDLANGQCTLFRVDYKDGKETLFTLGVKETAMRQAGTYQLRFANIDARLTLWVDRAMPFDDGVEYHPPELRAKDEDNTKLSAAAWNERVGPRANDLEPASVGILGTDVKVDHLKLWRDSYYVSCVNPPAKDFASDVRKTFDLSNPETFRGGNDYYLSTYYVQPGHYFCMGDNSSESSDSRYWGAVPQRLMLGRALAVYFPIQRIGVIR